MTTPRMRFVERFRAWLGGYFWLPCPLCGRHFSGREWNRSFDAGLNASIPTDTPGLRRGICARCAAKATKSDTVPVMLSRGYWILETDGAAEYVRSSGLAGPNTDVYGPSDLPEEDDDAG